MGTKNHSWNVISKYLLLIHNVMGMSTYRLNVGQKYRDLRKMLGWLVRRGLYWCIMKVNGEVYVMMDLIFR